MNQVVARLIIADVPIEPGKVGTIANGERLKLAELKSPDTPVLFNIK